MCVTWVPEWSWVGIWAPLVSTTGKWRRNRTPPQAVTDPAQVICRVAAKINVLFTPELCLKTECWGLGRWGSGTRNL